MTSAAKPSQKDASNKTWVRSLIAIGAAVALIIAGVVYYGTTVLPAQNAAKDVAGCKTFVVGFHKAQKAFLAEVTAHDHKPTAKTAVSNYVTVLLPAIAEARGQSATDGALAKGYLQVATDIETMDVNNATALHNGFSAIDGVSTRLETMCNTAFDNAGIKSPVKTATPTPTPSATM